MSLWPVAKPEGQIPQKCRPQSQRCHIRGVARMAVRERAGERGEKKTEVGESGGKAQRRKRGRMAKKKGGEEESRRGWVGGVSAGETKGEKAARTGGEGCTRTGTGHGWRERAPSKERAMQR